MTAPRRVLMTADAVGGVWTYALELSAALASYGVEVHLATMGRPPSPAQREQARHVRVHESTYALEWTPDPWADVDRAGQWLLALAGDLRPDVVHLNGYVHAALSWPAPVVVAAHSDVLSWWRAVHGTAAPASWDTYRSRVGAGLAAADAVVAPTAAMLAALHAEHEFAGGSVVGNGRCARWAEPGTAKEPVVLGVGRVWDEAKNLAALDRVAGRVPWPVRVAGDGPAGGSATYLGELAFDRLAAELLRAAVFVSPARYEPFGLAALEAAQAGCALVLGDIATLREVWQDDAVYVDPGSPDQLADVLTRLAADPEQVATLGSRARTRAARFTPARMAAGYLDVYHRLPVPTGGAR